MIIQCVEDYHRLELDSMPRISKMLFPTEPDQKSKLNHDMQSSSTTDSAKLRRVWLARRCFIAMEAIHNMALHNKSLFGGKFRGDAKEYALKKFQSYLTRHGGWQNIIQDAVDECSRDMLEITFNQTLKGFFSGYVLKYCLENMCSTEDASVYVADNIEIKKYDYLIIDGNELLFNSNGIDDKPTVHKYTSDYVRKKIWNKMKDVSYAWAAAVDIFKDAVTFTDRLMLSPRPFDFEEVDEFPSAGYAQFVSRAKHYYSLATLRRRSPKKNLPPLFKNPRPFLFD